MGRSQYSDKYFDDSFEYRHVVLPTEMAKLIPKNPLVSEDMDSGEIVVSSIRTGMKREFSMMMKAQFELGGLPVGRRRVTRSQKAGSAIKADVGSGGNISKKVKGSHSKIMKRDVEEKMARKDEEEVGIIEVLDSIKGVKSSLQEVETNMGNEVRSLEENLAVYRSEAKKIGADLKKDDVEPLCTESSVPQGGSSDGDVIHEDNRIVGGASDLGCERFGKKTSWLSEKPSRRFTRSALKLEDEAMGLEAGAGMAETGGAATSTSSPSKLEMKMSKKVELKRFPMKLKDLLETGLLEGLHVRYVHGSKVLGRSQSELCGVIQGTGILCSCNECKGEKVVTPNQFELHAHSGNKRPPEYIYLENGKSLRDVLNACKDDLSDSLETVIKNAIGRSDTRTTAFCLNCKELIQGAGADSSMLCDSCAGPKDIQINGIAHRSPLVDSSAPVVSSCQLEVPESVEVSSSSQPKMKPQGKLTRKDLRMHKVVLADSVLPEGTAFSYVMHGKKRLEGYKKDGAIFCLCCNKVVSPSQFEAHAGFASHRKPYHNIFTSNGVSLHQLSLELSKNRKSSTEDNDDLCSICEDGGNLLCCENCPRAFHSECVGLSRIPQGKWYCKYCLNMFEKEKFSERSANAIAAGRIAGIDPLEEINQRCIRIVGTFEADIGGCAICRGHGFSKSGFNASTVIICDQCEKEYHVGCLREQKIDDLKALPANEWFCCTQCQNVNTTLKKLIGIGEQMLPEGIEDLVKKKFEEQGSQHNPKLDIRWRLLSGKMASEDTRVWLSGAVSIFHDRFDPIADSSTGRLDLIPHMVYGRQFKNQDFCGMYCAILIVNSMVVSAGIVRIFGEEVAELPLVATRSDYQGKGYFQSLFFCVKNLLASLNVKDLVLPAADEAESLWKNRFGFEKLGQEQLDQYKKSYQMMIFQGTSVLHKSISKA